MGGIFTAAGGGYGSCHALLLYGRVDQVHLQQEGQGWKEDQNRIQEFVFSYVMFSFFLPLFPPQA